MSDDDNLTTNTTPEPSGAVRRAICNLAPVLGAVVYAEAIHADRPSQPDANAQKLMLAECGHKGVVMDLPHPDGVGNDIRLCLVCDSVPRMPRVIEAARRMKP